MGRRIPVGDWGSIFHSETDKKVRQTLQDTVETGVERWPIGSVFKIHKFRIYFTPTAEREQVF